MRLLVLFAMLGSIPALSAAEIPKGSSVFILDAPSDLRFWLRMHLVGEKVPLRIVHRSEDADYFLQAFYGPYSISTPDGRFVPVSVTLEVVDARDDQVVWSTTASRQPGWVVNRREYPPRWTVLRRLREAMGE